MTDISKLLAGRRVLVTGAARGLGLAFATAIAESGAKVALADILHDVLAGSVAALRGRGLDVQGFPLDMADPASIEACAAAATGWLGGLDGLVNNAAITNSGGRPSERIDIAMWDSVMAVNVRGTWLMTNACLPALRASGHGAIVNLASDTPLWGAPNLLAYVASKGAVIGMTRSLAREEGSHDITVNAVAPGLTKVEATEYVPAQRYQTYQDGRALQRLQVPDDVTGAVLFALSDLSRFVTGQVLAVNGGFVMN
ncbi:SDR family oxidoreductase [Pseudoduganella umbonata]|uniref:NAD(P)-dependent dehydrogenase (Short-subunit alcohol dehydrogenase family) n=1 Tax=Pseudoduganella umbonata TaxID=864828 RepID=A0A4P8HMY2_9BURK|nr:SDR family oxidoreductase [Pseudoduganella umbonata]MBB3219576.1 NAD(P)-dependent dehydrogenase (short-subunit alcohol dehydrogenase family) [Pseudoduganella umbonata]QCP09645.1 SDR family oxidoreductase [Pseudoduganella umbonata]